MKQENHPDPATLSLYHDGEGPKEMLRSIEEHIGECADCQANLEQLRTLSTAVAELPPLKAPATILKGIRRELVSPDAPKFPAWARGLAALFLVAFLGLLWWSLESNFDLSDKIRRLARREVTGPDEAPSPASTRRRFWSSRKFSGSFVSPSGVGVFFIRDSTPGSVAENSFPPPFRPAPMGVEVEVEAGDGARKFPG